MRVRRALALSAVLAVAWGTNAALQAGNAAFQTGNAHYARGELEEARDAYHASKGPVLSAPIRAQTAPRLSREPVREAQPRVTPSARKPRPLATMSL